MGNLRQFKENLAAAWPTRSPAVWWTSTAGVAALVAPKFGLLTGPLGEIAQSYGTVDLSLPAMALVGGLYVPLATAKWLELQAIATSAARATRTGSIRVGPQTLTLDDLFTSVLITGSPGTGKTAGVFLPMLDELAQMLNEEDSSPDSDYQKFGALILEVKGDLTEASVYILHEAGRCVSKDVMIVSPVSRIPVVRFKDEHGRFWHLCGRGGTDGNDAGRIIPRTIKHPKNKRDLPIDMFDLGPAALEEIEPVLKTLRLDVSNEKPNYLGWRWEGDALVRISHTSGYEKVEYVQFGGKQVRELPPKILEYVETIPVKNGIHYNFIDPDVSATEASARLAKVIKMAQGDDGGGSKDPYWENQMRKLISSCLMLNKVVETEQTTAKDILRMVTQESVLDRKLDALSKKIEVLKKVGEEKLSRDAREDHMLRNVHPLEDLAAFFTEEWKKMVADGKTANIIKSFVSGAFDAFLTDPNLGETFCSPSTFRFEDCIQQGKIIAMVPGRDYQKTATIFGTAIKEGFQGVMLSRNQRSDLNPKRAILQLIDEAQRYIVASGTEAGDPYFIAQSRSNRCINIYATQSYAWIYKAVGKDAGNVFLTCLGNQYWLQQTDPDTTKRASEICGNVEIEKFEYEHNLTMMDVSRNRDGAVKTRTRTEEKARFRPDDFTLLNTSDVISYVKGREGRRAKAQKGKLAFGFVTSGPGKRVAAARFRQYYREVMENRLFEIGESSLLDCRIGTTTVPTSTATTATAAGPSTTGATTGGDPKGQKTPTVKYESVLPLSDYNGVSPFAYDRPVFVDSQVRELLRDPIETHAPAKPEEPTAQALTTAPSPAPTSNASEAPKAQPTPQPAMKPPHAPVAAPAPAHAQPSAGSSEAKSAPEIPLPYAARDFQSFIGSSPASGTTNPIVMNQGAPVPPPVKETPVPKVTLSSDELERQRVAHAKLFKFPGLLQTTMDDASLAQNLMQEMAASAPDPAAAPAIADKSMTGPGGLLIGDTTKATPFFNPPGEVAERDLLEKVNAAQELEHIRDDAFARAEELGAAGSPTVNAKDTNTIRSIRKRTQTMK